ncbi:MAG: hypothetical protein IH840_17130 [Candidatus Heimdallarchaeota archaeon]|nr:hypothetical protein [Candidatus Heimdallarchaeota archaeon]
MSSRKPKLLILHSNSKPFALETIWYSRGWFEDEVRVNNYHDYVQSSGYETRRAGFVKVNPTSVESTNKERIKVHEFLMTELDKFIFEQPAIAQEDEIVMIGHSLGAVIAFDFIFQHQFEALKVDPESTSEKLLEVGLPINLRTFITMGSPIPIFSQALEPNDVLNRISLPPNVEWYNFYDPDDPIARLAQRFFPSLTEQGLLQQKIVNTGLILFSHTQYWNRPWWRKLLLWTHVGWFKRRDPASQVANILALTR